VSECPFKVGDKIRVKGDRAAAATVLAIDEGDLWARYSSDSEAFTIDRDRLEGWSLWVAPVVRKRWIVTTERRPPAHGERYFATGLTGPAHQVHLKERGDCHTGSFDVIVACELLEEEEPT
jgi:hypothetical protein